MPEADGGASDSAPRVILVLGRRLATDEDSVSGWRVLDVDGQFTVDAPRDAQWALENGGRAFVIRLPTAPVTEVRISRHLATRR